MNPVQTFTRVGQNTKTMPSVTVVAKWGISEQVCKHIVLVVI